METPTSEEALNKWIGLGIEESLTVEYKAAGSMSRESEKVTEISKDVSAMLNSSGGVLIYGVICFDRLSGKEHLPKAVDPILDPKISKEWLEQIINAKIRPRPDKIEIFPVRIEAGGVVFVLNIQAAGTAHQADDKRYYKRFNFLSVPMDDYEIRDVMSRRAHSIVRLAASISEGSANESVARRGSAKAHFLNLGMRNLGPRMVRNAEIQLYVPASILAEPVIPWLKRGETIYSKFHIRLSWISRPGVMGGFVNNAPLLPGRSIKLDTLRLNTQKIEQCRDERIYAFVFADDAPRREDSIAVGELFVRGGVDDPDSDDDSNFSPIDIG
jgi:hypothetical protein